MKNFFLRQFSGKINSSVQKQASSLLFQLLFPGILGIVLLNTSAQAQVSGTVFRDFNANGTYQSIPASGTYTYGEPGIAGITVVASTSTNSFTTTSSITGSYAFAVGLLPVNSLVRLEFSGFSTANLDYEGGQSAAAGASTSVQFVTATASTTANFGINYPRDFCQAVDQVDILTSCFNSAPNTGTDAAIIRFSPNEINDTALQFVSGSPSGANQFSQKPVMTESAIATQAQVGTVNGFAFHRRSRSLFAAAFARRSSPLPNGLGAIYRVNLAGATPVITLFTTVANVGNIGTVVGAAEVGRNGLGNIALSDDEQTLYAINLNTRALISISLGSGTPTAGASTSIVIPAPAGCTGDYRPFAIRVHRGKIYIGVTCGLADVATLRGVVYEYNGTTFTAVLNFPFTYGRADDALDPNPNNANYYGFSGFPNYIRNNMNWVNWDTYPNLPDAPDNSATVNTTGSGPLAKTQPWLTDITFDREDMILGIRSRLADAINNSFWVVGGDILRACSTTPGSWTLESNGVCGGIQSFAGAAPPNADPYTGRVGVTQNSRGPGGYEYYWGDDGFEGEAAQGSLLQIPGSPNVIVSQVDAIGHLGQVGVMTMSNRGGQITAAGNIFFGDIPGGGSANNIGKSNGLGAMDASCNAAPIEIGNRLWIDTDQDGIQDPNEGALAGVTVQLFAPAISTTTPIATTTTNAQGLYTFSSTSTTAITVNTALQLRIPSSQTALTGYRFSLPNQGPNDRTDSDFTPGATFADIAFTTGGAGQNDFSFDAGVVVCSFTATTTASSNNVCVGQPVVLTTLVTPSASYTYSVVGPAGTVITGGTTGTATVTGLATGTNTFTVTISAGPACFTTNVVSVTANAVPLLALTALPSAICLGQSVTLAAPVGGILGAGAVSFGVSSSLGTVLNPSASGVFSPTATTTFIASVPSTINVPLVGNVTSVITSCPVTVIVNQPPSLSAVSLSVCAGTNLNLTSLTGLIGSGGLGNVFRTGNITGIGTTVTTATIGLGSTQFNVISTNPLGCTASTGVTVVGLTTPTLSPVSASICIGSPLNLASLTGLLGSTPAGGVANNLLGLTTTLPGITLPTAVTAGVTTFSLVSTSITAGIGCSTTTPLTVVGLNVPTLAPVSVSLCIGSPLNLASLTGLLGSTPAGGVANNLLGLTTTLPGITLPTSVTAGVTTFSLVSTSITAGIGCSVTTALTVVGLNVPTLAPVSVSLCIGSPLNLASLTGLLGSTPAGGVANNLLGLTTTLPGITLPTSVTAGVTTFSLVSTSITAGIGCSVTTPLTVVGLNVPTLAPVSVSLCIGSPLNLASLTGLLGSTPAGGVANNLLGLTTTLPGITLPTAVTAGVTTFSLVSTSITAGIGCSVTTPLTVVGLNVPTLAPVSVSLCIGSPLNLASLTGLLGSTPAGGVANNLLGLTTTLPGITLPTSVTAGVTTFSLVSTSITAGIGCSVTTALTVVGLNVPTLAPVSVSLCIGSPLNLASLTGLLGSTPAGGVANNLLGLTTTLPGITLPTSVTAGVTTFSLVSTSITAGIGCSVTTALTVVGLNVPTLAPVSVSLCIGSPLNLASLTGLLGSTPAGGVANNLLGLTTTLPGITLPTAVTAGVTTFSLVSTSITAGIGCSVTTPLTVVGLNVPTLAPVSVSLCIGSPLNLASLTGLLGSTPAGGVANNLLGLTTTLPGITLPTAVTAGVTTFSLVSTSITAGIGCSTTTPLTVVGLNVPTLAPVSVSLCIGSPLNLASLTGLLGSTPAGGVANNLLGLTTTLPGITLPTAVTAGVTTFSLVSTSITAGIGCSTTTPLTVVGLNVPTLAPVSVSLCIGSPLNLASLTGLLGSTPAGGVANNLLGLTTTLPGITLPTAVTAGVTTFSLVSTSITAGIGCSVTTPLTVVGLNVPTLAPVSVSLCIGSPLNLASLTGLLGSTPAGGVANNLLGLTTTLPGITLPTAVTAGVTTFSLVSTSITAGIGCSVTTPLTVVGLNVPTLAPVSVSLCIGSPLNLASLTGLLGSTPAGGVANNLLGLTTTLPGITLPTAVTAGVTTFSLVSTSITAGIGCSVTTPLTVVGLNVPTLAPVSVSLCIGSPLNLASLTGLLGSTPAGGVANNLLGLTTTLPGITLPTAVTAGVTTFSLVSTSITAGIGCSVTTPLTVVGLNVPTLAPVSVSLCIGSPLNLASLTGLLGSTPAGGVANNLLGLTTTLPGITLPTAVTAGVTTFSLVSTSITAGIGCSTTTPLTVVGLNVPTLAPVSVSLCIGSPLNLASLTGLLGSTPAGGVANNLLGLTTTLPGITLPTAVTAGVTTFSLVSTSITAGIGCSVTTPLTVVGLNVPTLAPVSVSLCIGSPLNLASLTGLLGSTPAGGVANNLLGLTTTLPGITLPTAVTAGVTTFSLVSTSITAGIGCSVTTPLTVVGLNVPTLAPVSVSLCIGSPLNLASLTGLLGSTPAGGVANNLLGLTTTLPGITLPTAVTAGVTTFSLVSTSITAGIGCSVTTPLTVVGLNVPTLAPVSVSLCIGSPLNLASLTGLLGSTPAGGVANNLLGLTTTLPGITLPTSVTAGVTTFSLVSTSITAGIGCSVTTALTVVGLNVPTLAPVSVSLCIGSPLNLASLTGLLGSTPAGGVANNLLGLTTTLPGITLPTAVTAGVTTFSLVSTSITAGIGCSVTTPVTIIGVPIPAIGPLALSLCVGATLDLTSLTGLTGVGSLTNVFRTGSLLGLGTLVGTPTSVSIGADLNLFNVVSTNPFGCTTATPISITGVALPVVAPIAISVCVGVDLDLTSLTSLAGLDNVFRTEDVLGLGTLLGVPTAVSVGVGENLFNVVSTNPFGCTTVAPISVTGVPVPVIGPIALSLCVGTNLNLASLSALAGLTNVFRTGDLLGLGTLVSAPTAVSLGVTLFNVVSTGPFGCTTATPISVEGVAAPVISQIALSLCVGTDLDLTSLSGLAGLTSVFRVGSLLGQGTLVGTPTAVSIAAGENFFNVVSTSPLGCTTATPISVTGVTTIAILPINLSLCVGTNLDLTGISGLGELNNVFRRGNVIGVGAIVDTPTAITIGTGLNLFNVVSTTPFGCTTASPISITGVGAPVIAPIALSLCVGANVDLTSFSGLAGLTSVFRTGGLLGQGTLVGTPSSVSIGAGVNVFNVVSSTPLNCSTATPISITGVDAPVVAPIALSLCVGTDLDLTSLSVLTGLTNVFRTGDVLGLGTLLDTPTALSIGVGVNVFNVVSTTPFGCTTAAPISVTSVDVPALSPISLSLCVGANLNLASLSALTGLTNVFRTGNTLGLGTLVGTPASVSIGVGENLFNVVSTNSSGCSAATSITVIGVALPVVNPIALSLCVGTNLNLTSLSGLAGLGNVFRTGDLLGLGTLVGTPASVSIAAGVNLFNVVSSNPFGCTTATPISITGVDVPVVAPIALSLCVGVNLDLTSFSGLAGLTSVFRTGGLLGLGVLVDTPTAVSIGAGVNLFNVVSTSPFGCTTATPISITGVDAPVVAPIALSLCVGANVNLTSLSGLAGLTTIFREGGLLGMGTVVNAPTSVSLGVGVNLFNVVSSNPFGCTTATPISITGSATPTLSPISLSLCAGVSLDLTSLSGLAGLDNVFRTGGLIGLGTLVGTPASVSIGATVNLFNVVSTSPFGCSASTTISVTGFDLPVTTPVNLTLCATVGTPVNLSAILAGTGSVAGLTNTFRLGGLTGSVIANPVAVSLAAGVNLFTVTSTNPTGCTIITPIQVTLDIKPAISIAANLQSQTICEGSAPLPIVATVTSGTISGSLFFGPLADTTSLFSTTVGVGLSLTPTAAQLPAAGQTFFFALVANGTSSCSDTVFVAITTVPRPVVATTSLTICLGETVDLSAQLATQTGNSSSFFTTLLNAQAQVSPLVSLTVAPTVTTTFFTRVTLPVTGCFAIDSIVVTVNQTPSAGTNQTLVCGPLGETPTSATLTATPAGGSWSNAVGNPTVATFTPNSASTTVGGLAVGSYQFIYTVNNCQDTVVVVVPVCQTSCASVSVTALASSLSITPNQSVSLSASVSPAGSYTFAWSGPGVITPTTGATVVASNLTAGVNTFTVTVTTSPGCTTTATVSVTVLTPAVGISITDPGVCDPGTNTYTSTGVLSFTNAIPSTLTIVDGIRTTTVSVTAGQTTANFSLTGLISGTGTHTVVTVNGVGFPPASTTYVAPESCTVAACNLVVTASTASATVAQGQSASLTAIVSPADAYTYVWSAPAGITTTPVNASAVTTSGLPSGTYTFTVTVTNSASCVQTATVCVSVPFTPCANSNYAFSLTTVAGFGNYQWQYTAPGSASSTVVQSSSANSYVATLPGEYRVVITDAGVSNCPGNSCCPILIVELPAPVSLSVTAIAATCSTTSPAAENNAQLVLSGSVAVGTSYNISIGSTFMAMGTLFPTNQPLTGLTTGSILRTGLLNPPTAAGDTYTVRVFTADGCFADTVVTVPRSDCQCPPAKCVPIIVRKVVRVR